jgi:hypothetical protein
VTNLRRHRAGIVALAFVAAAIVLVLLAVDARAWQHTVARDDLRFRALPSHRGLWETPSLLPGDPAGALLGTGDTMTTRHAEQLFWFSRLGADPQSTVDLPTLRARTQRDLNEMLTNGGSTRERSYAANLLGVLVITTPDLGTDRSGIEQLLRNAAGYFQRAIAIDPANVAAKQNLELVLRIKQPGKGRIGHDARAGYGFGRGRGATLIGSGY